MVLHKFSSDKNLVKILFFGISDFKLDYYIHTYFERTISDNAAAAAAAAVVARLTTPT